MEPSYDTAIDIWALGSVVAEMSMCINKGEVNNNKIEKRVLFPG